MIFAGVTHAHARTLMSVCGQWERSGAEKSRGRFPQCASASMRRRGSCSACRCSVPRSMEYSVSLQVQHQLAVFPTHVYQGVSVELQVRVHSSSFCLSPPSHHWHFAAEKTWLLGRMLIWAQGRSFCALAADTQRLLVRSGAVRAHWSAGLGSDLVEINAPQENLRSLGIYLSNLSFFFFLMLL